MLRRGCAGGWRVKHIVFVSGYYPTDDAPAQAFVQTIAHAIADSGVRCMVISPQSITRRIVYGRKKRPREWYEVTKNGKRVRILQPETLSFGRRKIGGVSVTSWLRSRAIRRALRHAGERPDAIYAHFWHFGIEAASAVRHSIPVVVASGEESIIVDDECGATFRRKNLRGVRGLIAVSTKNLRESAECGLLQYGPKTTVLLNAVDPAMFFPMERAKARERLGLAQEDTIAIFVGSFEERKGPERVLEAAKRIPGLKLILLGAGKQRPQSDQLLFAGTVPHGELAVYLNAADFFVLPTLAEGCCNAIIEAMACGLPVISSDRPFNDDVLTSDNSIRIDPTRIDELAAAMERLCRDAELRQRLSQGALATAAGLRIQDRVQRLIAFMEEVAEDSRQ